MCDKIKTLEHQAKEFSSQFKLMQHHELVEYILGVHGLEYYFNYFTARNKSATIPYHNQYHTYCMVLNVYEASLYHELNVDSRRSLLVAALFHDINHSGGTYTDDVNIKIAVDTLVSAHKLILETTRSNPMCGDHYVCLTPQELVSSVETINSTKYPYNGPPDTLLQEIIRDADLMQVYEENPERLRKQFLGLKSEMEIKHGPFTPEQWADGCKDFNDKVIWHTQWAKDKSIALDHKACTDHLRNLLLGIK